MQVQRSTLFLIAVSLSLALLAGCAPVSTVKQPSAIDQQLARAEAAVARGNHNAAGLHYRRLAVLSGSALRGDYLLLATEQFMLGNSIEEAKLTLEQTRILPLDAVQEFRRHVMENELLLADKRPLDVLQRMAPFAADMPATWVRRQHRVLSQAFRMSGNLLESARELTMLDLVTEDPVERLEGQLDILRDLVPLSEQMLTLLQPSPPGIEGGWMDLALIIKRHEDDPAELKTQFEQWRALNPVHPALPELLDSYFQKLQSQIRHVRHVAVLLPDSGKYASAAAAIRDGIMAAWYRQPPELRPLLKFYSVNNEQESWPVFTEAVAAGAESVIGPLDKADVLQLARAGTLPVPVLALNHVATDTIPPDNLFQYALSPEDEARQVAEKAWIDGKRRPVLLQPTGSWGSRLAGAFIERWRELSDNIAGVELYNPESFDHSNAIRSLLHLDQSLARNRELEQALGKQLEFEPRRRADADFVFLIARPKQARQLRPQLQFHYAGDLPLYATSHAWNGTITAQEAPDVQGIILPDIPWLFDNNPGALSRDQLARLFADTTGTYPRLQAMGIDAYRLLPHLQRLQESPLDSLNGLTGNLYMDSGRQIHRQLTWISLAEQPMMLGFSPRMDLLAPELLQATTQQEEMAIDTEVVNDNNEGTGSPR